VSRACEGGRCPGTTGGALKSPGFPLAYPDKAQVTYQLETIPGTKIDLKFEVLDIERIEGTTCRLVDYVNVCKNNYCGGQYFCGKTIPPIIRSKSNKMTVRFFSDYNQNGQGFLATWKQVLPEDVIEGQTEGVFTSPNYPNKYPPNTKVSKSFVIPQNSKVEFTVVDFNTEGGYDLFCTSHSPDSHKKKIAKEDKNRDSDFENVISHEYEFVS
jgi:cubilin